jgi:hypothetical protein
MNSEMGRGGTVEFIGDTARTSHRVGPEGDQGVDGTFGCDSILSRQVATEVLSWWDQC